MPRPSSECVDVLSDEAVDVKEPEPSGQDRRPTGREHWRTPGSNVAPSNATLLLEAHRRGESGALDRLVDLVYDDLRRIARSQLRKRSGRRDLETTALVSEAYLKLVEGSGLVGTNRDHFLAVCARAMRFVLIDFARERTAQKRGGQAEAETLEEELVAPRDSTELATVLALHEALEGLQESAPRLVQVVECRYFAGLSLEETAAGLGVSTRTVERDWRLARAQLMRLLGKEGLPVMSGESSDR